MKKLVLVSIGFLLLLLLVTLLATGCAEDVAPTPGLAADGACNTCHENEDVLEAVADEEEEVESESEGEG